MGALLGCGCNKSDNVFSIGMMEATELTPEECKVKGKQMAQAFIAKYDSSRDGKLQRREAEALMKIVADGMTEFNVNSITDGPNRSSYRKEFKRQ